MELIPAVASGFQIESSLSENFSSAQLTFYEEKAKSST